MDAFVSGLVTILVGMTLQSAAQDPAIATVEDVVVHAGPGDPIARFVEPLIQPGRHGRFSGQIARWGRPVCLGVVGIPEEVAAELAARTSEIIRSLNIQTGKTGCATNALIIVADEADGFAEGFADRHRTQMFENRSQAISDFVGPSRVVRWHHRTRAAGAGRAPTIDTLAGATGAFGGQLPNTRLKMSTSAQIMSAVLIIDRTGVDYATTDALVAYLAFTVLLDLPSKPEVQGRDTILNLFADEAGRSMPLGLSDWDRAFVQAVYAMRPDQPFSVQQADIADGMRRAFSNTESP